MTSSSRIIACSVVASAGSGTFVAIPRASQRDWYMSDSSTQELPSRPRVS